MTLPIHEIAEEAFNRYMSKYPSTLPYMRPWDESS